MFNRIEDLKILTSFQKAYRNFGSLRPTKTWIVSFFEKLDDLICNNLYIAETSLCVTK